MLSQPKFRTAYYRQFLMALTISVTAPMVAFAAELDAAEFDAFIARQEKAMDAAKKELLGKIDARGRRIRRSKLSDADIRRGLNSIAEDRQALADHDRLPNADELLDLVVACVDDYQRISDRIEDARAHWAERAVKVDDPAAMARFSVLEKRLHEITAGREQFTAGTTWSGEQSGPTGSYQLRLNVKDVTGTSFRGTLAQTGKVGRADLMEIEGRLNGNRIALESTQMLRGKNRKFVLRGYLLGDRIVTSIEGISVKGEPVTGWVSLWKGANSRRRG